MPEEFLELLKSFFTDYSLAGIPLWVFVLLPFVLAILRLFVRGNKK